ncbi:MAG: SDR family oxidoreductase [Gemmatimonadetes bacterium]|nr:SDR family oxidoreductase [Gemmatimonadota bacterium]
MNDPVVLVTGGAGNLGQAVTRRFLNEGGQVAVPIYKGDAASALDDLSAEYGARLYTFGLDLTTERGSEQAVQRVVEWAGRIDAVAHLIGGYLGEPRLAETDIESWDRMMDLNLKSAWLIARAALPVMTSGGGGSFVFVSSRSALRERAGHVSYAVAKSALITLTEAIAEEYAGEGIRANAVIPGIVDTPRNRRGQPDADHSRWTSPDEIARVIVFLASKPASAINAASIPVYGRS